MDSKIIVARCHEIQMMVQDKEVHRFEGLTEIFWLAEQGYIEHSSQLDS